MDENRQNILHESNRVINKLQVYAVFFEEDIIYKIYLRLGVIHKLFEANEEIDINKLDLFHLQFTTPVIELLKKIKKNNEGNVSLLFDEIQLNKDLIDKLNSQLLSEKTFNLEKQRQSLKVNNSLRKLFQVLSDDSAEYPFVKNINVFSARFSEDFYFEIPAGLFASLVEYNTQEVYTNAYAVIHKKLMGLLCKYDFKTEFFYGLKAGNVILEVYKFLDTNRYFLFSPSRNLFLFCDIDAVTDIDWSNTKSKNERIIQELNDKNDKLQASIHVMKAYMPAEIKALLSETYKKISEIDFLNNISSADVQANILKTMLNTDIM
jgi:hypothetical protein